MSEKVAGISLSLGLIIGLVIGTVFGLVGYAYLTQDFNTSNLEIQIDFLEKQMEYLQGQLNDSNLQIKDLLLHLQEKNNEIDALQGKIEELEKIVPPLVYGQWNLIAIFEGNSGYTTDYFYIPEKELKISWDWESNSTFPGFGINLYKNESGNNFEVEILFELQDRGLTYIHNLEKANYYLEIIAHHIDKWKITIEIFIPEKS